MCGVLQLIKPLPTGARLSIVLDCYEGGQLCDLPYVFRASEQNTQVPYNIQFPLTIPCISHIGRPRKFLRNIFTKELAAVAGGVPPVSGDHFREHDPVFGLYW